MNLVEKHACPLCALPPVAVEATHKNDDGSTTLKKTYTCFCLSGEGATDDEAAFSWNRAVEGFMARVANDRGAEKRLVTPKKRLILPN